MIGILLRTDGNPLYLLRWFLDRKRSPRDLRLPWLGYRVIAALRRYASQIDEFPDGHFDVILVDGPMGLASVAGRTSFFTKE